MTLDEIKTFILQAGIEIKEEKRLANNTGTQLKLSNGGIVNFFDKGTYNIQGKNQEVLRNILKDGETLSNHKTQLHTSSAASPRKVFVVYGHDEIAKNQLEAMLRRWELEPLILDQLPSEGQTIIEKLEKYTSEVNFAVVLATPDDEGFRAGRPDEKAFRARQNVVLELGMMLANLGRQRVAILLKQQENMERPSDIQGLIYIPFKDDLQKDAGPMLAKEMAAQGYEISVKNL